MLRERRSCASFSDSTFVEAEDEFTLEFEVGREDALEAQVGEEGSAFIFVC